MHSETSPLCPVRQSDNKCSSCGILTPCQEMRQRKKGVHGHDLICRVCCNEYSRKRYSESAAGQQEYARNWYRQYAQRSRDNYLKRHYAMSLDQYNEILQRQGGTCIICFQTCKTGRSLSTDHDHACCPGSKSCGKCIRGLLCRGCNLAIGYMEDDPDRLRAAADYLEACRRQQAA